MPEWIVQRPTQVVSAQVNCQLYDLISVKGSINASTAILCPTCRDYRPGRMFYIDTCGLAEAQDGLLILGRLEQP